MTPNWMELIFEWIQRKDPGPGAAAAPGPVPAGGPDPHPARGPHPPADPDPGIVRAGPGLVPEPKLYRCTTQMLVTGHFMENILEDFFKFGSLIFSTFDIVVYFKLKKFNVHNSL
jgi:hypothetical protein